MPEHSEAGFLWYLMYSESHLKNIQMEPSTSDCFLLNLSNASVRDDKILQANNNNCFCFGDDVIHKDEEER